MGGYYILSYKALKDAKSNYDAFQELYDSSNKEGLIPRPVTLFEYK